MYMCRYGGSLPNVNQMAAVGGGGGGPCSDASNSAAPLSGKESSAQPHILDLCFLSKILTKCHARFRQEHLLQSRPDLGQHYLRLISLTDGLFQGRLKFLIVATLCL